MVRFEGNDKVHFLSQPHSNNKMTNVSSRRVALGDKPADSPVIPVIA